MLKKILNLIFCLLFICVLSGFAKVLQGTVAIDVPEDFYGTWRVSSVLVDTNSPGNFKKKNADLWNISKKNDVITLSNPFSGAKSSVNVDYANANTVKFSTRGNYDNKILIDEVEIHLDNDKFTGINIITLETHSDIDNRIVKTVKAKYTLKGDRIATMGIGE